MKPIANTSENKLQEKGNIPGFLIAYICTCVCVRWHFHLRRGGKPPGIFIVTYVYPLFFYTNVLVKCWKMFTVNAFNQTAPLNQSIRWEWSNLQNSHDFYAFLGSEIGVRSAIHSLFSPRNALKRYLLFCRLGEEGSRFGDEIRGKPLL